ncbi:serine hydrolase domain-containing protein [Sandarakinorhabdus sp.]|uniref:serine hydrolase domain-containing protein n=1 Tax=Sandarakinorhabdus sp. TaxID=1916663 RepID=UPI00333FCF9E
MKRLPRGFQASSLDRHEFSPAHLADVKMDDDDEPELVLKKEPKVRLPKEPAAKIKPTLDVNKFVNSLNQHLTIRTVGHVMQLNQNGTPIYYAAVGWAHTKINGEKVWTADTKMHVASVSKLLTAMGMLKALGTHGLNPDTRIAQFLPAYWQQGENINQITFAHLLTHRSGFRVPGTKTGFLTMKREVAAGVQNVGEDSGYENANFGLMRILIPIVIGDIDRDRMFHPNAETNDVIWDGIATDFYRDYMQDNVFEPAGVSGAGFLPMPAAANGALAYAYPNVGQTGWNSGDLATVAGGAGWRLSIKELMSVLSHFRRTNKILTPTAALAMLSKGYGLNGNVETDVGTIYVRKGGWGSGDRKEQCIALFLPDGMELAVFANSAIGPDDEKIKKVVLDKYLAAIS